MKQAERRKHHYIYKITRTDGSDKFYIGMHSTDNLDDGYFGSGQRLWKSIKKHGKEKHSKEILEFLDSREALKLREKEIVNEELLGDKKCMNLKLGGEGGWDHQNLNRGLQRAKGAKGLAKKKALRETSDIWRKRESETQSTIMIAAYANGKIPPGWSLQACEAANSETARAKRQMTFENHKHQQGEKNSQHGTRWVSNIDGAIKIKQYDLMMYLEKGYTQGRKFIPK